VTSQPQAPLLDAAPGAAPMAEGNVAVSLCTALLDPEDLDVGMLCAAPGCCPSPLTVRHCRPQGPSLWT